MNIARQLHVIKKKLPASVTLVAVSKFHANDAILEAYEAGQRIFGESRVQELILKQEQLPKDIEWHFIGHLQMNKVKYIIPFIHTIQSVDSIELLKVINQLAEKSNRTISILIQIHIAEEEHKYGFSYKDAENLFKSSLLDDFSYISVSGLMGMATWTDEMKQIRKEFAELSRFFQQIKKEYFANKPDFKELSMGMSNDYPLAIEQGSTMIRIGSKIFGERR